MRFPALLLTLALAGCSGLDESAGLRDSVTLYASFDEALQADFAVGSPEMRTRYGALDDPDGFRFEDGVPGQAFRIAAGEGVQGGALEAYDVLPENGRIFFPAEGNLAYSPDGWSGTVSFWLKTNPDTMLKTPFCDPVQITQRGATNGGLWVDFPNTEPRDFRLGAFQSEGDGRERIDQNAPDAPLVVVEEVGFQAEDWHHILFIWSDFDSGAENAQATLYIDGEPQGSVGGRAITMDWEIAETGIYVAVNYIGLLDELAVFDRPLEEEEIATLASDPAAVGNTF